ncbi:diguanylate cyclase domain-containing protein [[Limnothrix rosea] IAM M-220]|uniref:GGDEF domain-containing response regulator n=1 Tax=[Limnothrix rosea] IAM M-220 TaxID=454133 RepID=UPI00096544B0|nr:diguanylate cyclase [[Limnothrix rosea] IAM M-220]OKH13156.1 diguanylate cyclase response regulator [[Limnothrix rosea] IAM M-220]
MTIEQPLSPNKHLILIVDDDPIIRRLIRFAMEKEGYEVVEAANGEAGLELFWQRIPDIVLLDFMMPVMNGIEFCQKLQQVKTPTVSNASVRHHSLKSSHNDASVLNSAYFFAEDLDQPDQLFNTISRTPILMITGLEDPHSVTQAFDAGATDFITKPINWAILKQRVKHLLNQAKLYQRLEATNEQLQRLAAIDPLTQLANRRVFDLVFKRQWRLMLRHQTPFSLIFADIDYFKRFNDLYGHQAGDHCLFEVAQAIAAQVRRPTDLVARYGGEEIIVLLPETNYQGAEIIADKIQNSVRSLQIPHEKSEVSPYVTVSLGVASIEKPAHHQTISHFLEVADQALYEAKARGRNCTVGKLVTLD